MRARSTSAPSRPPAPRSRRLRARSGGPGLQGRPDPARVPAQPAAPRDLVAAVHHELRTPLTVVVGWTEVLASGAAGELTAEQQMMVSAVERGATRVEDLLADLLVLAGDRLERRGCRCRSARTAPGRAAVRDAARRLAGVPA